MSRPSLGGDDLLLVDQGAQEPVLGPALLAGDDDIVPNLALQGPGRLPIGRRITDELEGVRTSLVIPGVRSMGPASMRVKGMITVSPGELVGSPQALNA